MNKNDIIRNLKNGTFVALVAKIVSGEVNKMIKGLVVLIAILAFGFPVQAQDRFIVGETAWIKATYVYDSELVLMQLLGIAGARTSDGSQEYYVPHSIEYQSNRGHAILLPARTQVKILYIKEAGPEKVQVYAKVSVDSGTIFWVLTSELEKDKKVP